MSPAGIREIIESVIVAFVLAFLFRTFEAEAFVIPTGSMAPTLMGRHKDVACPKCGFAFQVGASEEVDPQTGASRNMPVVAGTCPNCRFTFDMAPGNPQHESYLSFRGDRILVAKFPYQLAEPDRWDVVVFKYPSMAKMNFIKRVVGLPDETLQIWHGDIWVKHSGESGFSIARKPPNKVVAMMQPVYDSDSLSPELIQRGWPARWQPQTAERGIWKSSSDGKSFSCEGTGQGAVWLRYEHRVPNYLDWQCLLENRSITPSKPQLITDFAAYNTDQTRSGQPGGMGGGAWDGGLPDHAFGMGIQPQLKSLGLNWVGDLILEGTFESQTASGQVLLDLVKGGFHFRCELDLARQTASLAIDGQPKFHPTATLPISGPGKHRFRFANVDHQLLLWIDGSLIQFDQATVYSLPDAAEQPQEDDLQPVGIGSKGAALVVSHLRLCRDIYYIAESAGQGHNGEATPHYSLRGFTDIPFQNLTLESVPRFFSDPSQWDLFTQRRHVEFLLEKDQFFMLGDNSAASKDSRLWLSDSGPHVQYFVDRELLIGKALFIYWPHSWNVVPGTPIPFPFFPNFPRMGFVR